MKQPFKIQWKSPKLLSQRIRKRYYKTYGTSVINSPMSPPSLHISLLGSNLSFLLKQISKFFGNIELLYSKFTNSGKKFLSLSLSLITSLFYFYALYLYNLYFPCQFLVKCIWYMLQILMLWTIWKILSYIFLPLRFYGVHMEFFFLVCNTNVHPPCQELWGREGTLVSLHWSPKFYYSLA